MTLNSGNGLITNNTEEFVKSHSQILDDCIRNAVQRYFSDMGDHEPENLYKIFLQQIERPLLEEVLRWAGDNQTRTARILGLNRGTLRKKLSQFNEE